MKARRLATALQCVLALTTGCIPNNPYPSAESHAGNLYSFYVDAPRHLDPARAYSSRSSFFVQQTYEPPLQYHYLKRPYELVPLTARQVPVPVYRNAAGRRLSPEVTADSVASTVYVISIRRGILFHPHACFGRDGQSQSATDTRELTAADYVYQIKRLAQPTINSPVFSTLARHIVGLQGLRDTLVSELERIRVERRRAAGVFYDQEADEQAEPIWLDLDLFELAGARVVDRYTYEIELVGKYPQFIYWLAMHFFSPMPREAERYFATPAMVSANLNLDNRMVGTGPYVLEQFVPHREITMVRNETFHEELYPETGSPGDGEAGLLADAGRQLPFIDRLVFKLEKESIPRWSKFVQGYYERGSVYTEVFDQAIEVDAMGGLELSQGMQERGIQLSRAVAPKSYYMAFNMLDSLVGGYGEDRRKLRQAISIAVDFGEWVQLFANGRGIVAQDPLPAGIFGSQSGRQGLNPFVFQWDEAHQAAVPRPLADARRLLAEAGYPNGTKADGTPLTLHFDSYWTGASAHGWLRWYRKQFAKIGIDLQVRQTDYNRFRQKLEDGQFQITMWGWSADYPDPENFLFLLYGPNSTARFGGANRANYANPEFDRLFPSMVGMPNSPARQVVIDSMVHIAREDAPWVWGYHPVTIGLHHEWYRNFKDSGIGHNQLKYRRIDRQLRDRRRSAWNAPVLWPLSLLGLGLAACATWGTILYRRRERQTATS